MADLFSPTPQPAPQQQGKAGIRKLEETRKIVSYCLKFGASATVCLSFNPEKLPQTSVLISRNRSGVPSEEATFYLAQRGGSPAWGHVSPLEVEAATAPGLPAARHSPGQQKEHCSPCSHRRSQGEPPRCPSRHGLGLLSFKWGVTPKHSSSYPH